MLHGSIYVKGQNKTVILSNDDIDIKKKSACVPLSHVAQVTTRFTVGIPGSPTSMPSPQANFLDTFSFFNNQFDFYLKISCNLYLSPVLTVNLILKETTHLSQAKQTNQ